MENEKLTKEEAEKLYNANAKGLKLVFGSYYKYSFTFVGENSAIDITVRYGGSSDDIYRFDCDKEPIDAPETFEKLMGEYYDVNITEKATGKKFEDYHY